MEQVIKIFFSPIVFALCFLWPLATQVMTAASVLPGGWQAILAGAVLAIPFGLMAQLRGSWLWIK